MFVGFVVRPIPMMMMMMMNCSLFLEGSGYEMVTKVATISGA
jgi:hypothetical protein